MPMFGADGRVLDRQALRSLQFRGQGFKRPRVAVDRAAGTRTTEVLHNDDGGTAALTTEHKDGRVDANVMARAVDVTTRLQEG